MRVLVTGSSGFVGTTLCTELLARGHNVTAAVRTPGTAPHGTSETIVPDIGSTTDWTSALKGQDAVVHLAARVHVMNESAADPLSAFRAVNTAGTIRLAEMARLEGVTSLVHMSSIKANGEGRAAPYTIDDTPAPVDAYGISKLEAEHGVSVLAADSNMHVTSIRIPLVYGPGAGGNFARLLNVVRRGIPLPLAAVENRRSMIAIWNLVDLIEHQLRPATPGYELVIAADSEALSTPALMRAIGRGLGRSARLLWFPLPLLALGGRILRRSAEVQRLTGSLEVVTGSSRPGFTWQPPMATNDAIERAAREWSATRK